MGAPPPPPSGILVPARGEGGTAAVATKPAVASVDGGWDRLGCMAIFMREENSLRLGLGCRFSGVPIRPSSLAVVGALIMGSMEDEEGTAHAALLVPPTPVSPPKDDEETKESGAGKSPGAGSDMVSSDG